MQAAVLARLGNPSVEQHQQDGLLKSLQLCEKFINSNVTSAEAYDVLKQEVAAAMTAQHQVRRDS